MVVVVLLLLLLLSFLLLLQMMLAKSSRCAVRDSRRMTVDNGQKGITRTLQQAAKVDDWVKTKGLLKIMRSRGGRSWGNERNRVWALQGSNNFGQRALTFVVVCFALAASGNLGTQQPPHWQLSWQLMTHNLSPNAKQSLSSA